MDIKEKISFNINKWLRCKVEDSKQDVYFSKKPSGISEEFMYVERYIYISACLQLIQGTVYWLSCQPNISVSHAFQVTL